MPSLVVDTSVVIKMRTRKASEGVELMQALMTKMVGGEPYQFYPLGEYIVRAPGVCGGRPTFKYTRIEIIGTLERLATGESMEDIVAGYRGREIGRASCRERV